MPDIKGGKSMQTLTTIKPGETFAIPAQIETDDGTPITGAADKFKCQIRNTLNKLIADVEISETDEPGQYIFKVANTENWPVGTLLTDILYNDGGKIQISETLKIIVVKEVTKKDV